MPIALTLDKEAASFHLFQQNSDHSILGTNWETEKIQKLLDPWDTHPAGEHLYHTLKKGLALLSLTSSPTDVCNERVGAAYMILDDS